MISFTKVEPTIYNNPDEKDLKSFIGDILFMIGIFCEFVASFTGYLFGNYHEQQIILVGMGFFTLKILFSLDIKSDWLTHLIFAVIGLMCFKVQGSALVLRFFLILLAGRDQDVKKVVKLFFYGTLITMVVTGILASIGLYGETSVSQLFRNESEVRFCFGFVHPNAFAFFLFRLLVMFFYLYGDSMKWWGYALTIGVYGVFTVLCSSKISMAAGIVAIMMAILARIMKGEKARQVYYLMGLLGITVVICFTYAATAFYSPQYENGVAVGFWENANYVFTGRLHGAYDTIRRVGTHLFGVDKNVMATEMGFTAGLVSYGSIFMVIYIVSLYVLYYELYKKNDMQGLAMVASGTAYAFAENFLPYVNKNPAIVLGIGCIFNFGIVFGKKAISNSDDVKKNMSDKKTIKIDFVDFWPDFKKEDNFFINILNKHYNVEICDKPDYLFCSSFGHEHHKYRDAVKIHFTGENVVPDFNLYDYAMGFHYMEFEDRYIRLPLYALYDTVIEKSVKKHEFDDAYYLGKKGFTASVVSNPDGAEARDAIIDAIDNYKKVDNGGRYRNNVGGPVADKFEFIKDYKFVLAIENSMQHGYTTEKILEAFSAGGVPVYWGSPDIKKEFNPDSFIYAGDFDSYEALAQRIKEIDQDDNKYLSMVKAPMILEDSQAADYLKEEYTEKFLLNIFDQDLNNAYRRNMVYIGKKYQCELRDAYQIVDFFGIFRKVSHTIWKKKMQKSSRK